jgi:O-antigen/teichoic acid export membrane protein
MKELIKSFLAFGLATSIEKILGFIVLPIYTNIFSASEFGSLDLIQTIVSTLVVFGALQLETSLQRYYYGNTGLRRDLLVSNIFIVVLFFSIIVGLLLFIFSKNIADMFFNGENVVSSIQIASLQIPFININMLGLLILRYNKQNIKFLIIIIIKVIITLIFVFIFVVNHKLGIFGVFLSQGLTLVLTTTLTIFFLKNYLKIRISKIIIKKSFKYAYPQIPARIGSVTLSYANRFIMLGYLSVSMIGIYSVSLKWASVIQMLYTTFVMAWGPFMFAQFKQNNHTQIFPKVLIIVCSIIFYIVSIVSLFSKELIDFASSPAFSESSLYIGGLALYFSLFIIKEIVDIGPKFTEKTRYLSFNFFFSVIVNVGLLLILTPLLGIKGVVISMLITNLFLIAISWFTSNKLHYVPFQLMPFILTILPVLILVVTTMYIPLSLSQRIILLIFLSLYYGVYFLRSFKMVKGVI